MAITKTCEFCAVPFTIYDEDVDFYKKIDVPEPKKCPLCREQNRLAFRNERKLYLRPCESCKKQMVSIYSPDKPYHVYCQTCWWSDKWDPVNVGRDFDFNRPFFEQFDELLHASKVITLFGKNNQNSDYVNQETDDKNCYLNVGGHFNEDCFYNTYSLWGKNNVDNIWVVKSQLLYMCVNCENCYNGTYLNECINCTDCHYCWDCFGCQNCFGSFGLRHKQYYFFNQQLDKKEYSKKVGEYLQDYDTRENAREESLKHFLKFPHRANFIFHCENSVGDRLINCKKVSESFICEDMEDCKYAYIDIHLKDSMDVTSVGFGELIYNCASSVELNNTMSLTSTTNLNFSKYCFVCFNSSNLFGCVGLNRKQYCILNKQYSEAEYKELLPKIIEHMKRNGEYGNFFPMNISPFCYNETVAQEYFPLTKEKALKNDFKWKDNEPKQQTQKTSNEILECVTCDKNFKIISQEADFYKRTDIPNPRQCPDCRHSYRMSLKNPRQFWKRECSKCGTNMLTPYSPDKPEIVYCEKCYLENVY